MTTKQKLLAAARTCLLERGYGNTSVRELVAESGTNQASINYHFSSKETLLNQALFELNSEWGELLFGALTDDLDAGEPASGVAADVARWQRVIDSIRANRALWFLNFESIALAQHNDTIRAGLAERGEAAREVLARVFGGLTEENSTPADRRAVGSHHYSVLIGVAMQWLTDPGTAPTAEEIARS